MFLIVTPLGLADPARVARALERERIRVVRRTPVPDWARVGNLLHPGRRDAKALLHNLAFSRLWNGLFPGARAERWDLATRGDYLRLVRNKKRIRDSLPEWRVEFLGAADPLHANLHAFHLPDPAGLGREERILSRAGETSARSRPPRGARGFGRPGRARSGAPGPGR